MNTRGITTEYERRLWDELNAALVDVVPADATPSQAEDAMLVAATGVDAEVRDLYERVRSLAREREGFLRERWDEDGPVPRLRRRMERRAQPTKAHVS